jgi:hypothetical protein
MRSIRRDQCHAAELGSQERPTFIGGRCQGREELHAILLQMQWGLLGTGDTAAEWTTMAKVELAVREP